MSKYYFDPEDGERVIQFTESHCRHLKGRLAGELIVWEPWQREIIMDVFGWKHKDTGLRRYQYIYIEVPKKNGKSTMLAALSLYLLGWDGEKGGEIYGAAGDKDQARIIFDDAVKMVEKDAGLERELKPLRNVIKHTATDSVYRVVSAEAYTKHGPNLFAVIFDEIAIQPNSELYDTLRKGVAAREEPMIWMITTAQRIETFGEELHSYAKNIIDGKLKDDRWYAKIYAADRDDDIFDPKTWYKANPSLGSALSEKYFEDEIQEIKNDPSKAGIFKRLHLNIWTTSTDSWHVADLWDECDFGKVKLKDVKGRPLFLGFDFAYTDDMNSAVVVCPPVNEGDKLIVWPFFWVPDDTVMQRSMSEHHMFLQWTENEIVFTQPYKGIEVGEIADFILKESEGHNVMGIGYDIYRANDAIKKLEKNGLPCFAFRQAPGTMGKIVSDFEKMVNNQQINHQGNQVLRWQIDNVEVYDDRELNRWIQKRKSKGKVDGVTALLNACAAWKHVTGQAEEEKKVITKSPVSFI